MRCISPRRSCTACRARPTMSPTASPPRSPNWPWPARPSRRRSCCCGNWAGCCRTTRWRRSARPSRRWTRRWTA
ncbi:hypothetical protein CV_3440 [Chromobacterium violaceum ATCC 12472]|uniref:Uncharacterized protein n=1 Tax=Chromobacterium violaceum (strain ATCC 12472 / DSM 30191 / JCM 1249 / CCUG 213 / NBRC 12614 / NCIMB 9131 / NCTC 9757 / MK) TaxID=243365 RepID=Q7NPR1_CHRVO|nr:hypothetical protein CV_3440 [Chromobacterium violaceum ATCC 12472]